MERPLSRGWSALVVEVLALALVLQVLTTETPLGALLLGERDERHLRRFFATRLAPPPPLMESPAVLARATAVGVPWPRARALAAVAARRLLPAPEQLVVRYGEYLARLGSDEAAVAAVFGDGGAVERAIARAQAAGQRDACQWHGFSRWLAAAERRRLGAVASEVRAFTGAYAMRLPLAPGSRLTSAFGYRLHPLLQRRKLHTGVDLAAPTGTPIHAAQAGVVAFAGYDSINGRFVRLDHGDGLTSTYCHGSTLLVQRGAQVAQGMPIALVGASGRATGPHLHFQVELDGQPVDPALFMWELTPRAAADRPRIHAK